MDTNNDRLFKVTVIFFSLSGDATTYADDRYFFNVRITQKHLSHDTEIFILSFSTRYNKKCIMLSIEVNFNKR